MKEFSTQTKQRIASIDILRGAIMIIMALDHVRDFFHISAMTDDPLNLATTTPLLYFTRWITHFCAPIFVFLSGTSAFLAGQKKSKKELGKFLITRGLWLILMELAVITLGWTFDPLYHIFVIQVIWAIGWSMIILGLLINLSWRVIAVIGVTIIVAHNLLDYVQFEQHSVLSVLMNILFVSRDRVLPLGQNHVALLLYAIVPWTGIMMLGYGFGILFTENFSIARRKRLLITSGCAAILIFIVLRFANAYGDPQFWSLQKNSFYTFLSFLNVTKYPPSLLYTCVTIGSALIILALIEQCANRFTSVLQVFGRVPFFYYLLHIALIHTIVVIAFYVSGYDEKSIADGSTPFLFRPASFGYSLGVVYVLWIFVVAFLYLPCRWFSKYRQRHNYWWLSYL